MAIFATLLFVSCDMDDAEFYKVTFNSAGGTEVQAQKVAESGKATEPQTPKKDGYVFFEWQQAGKKFDFNTRITKDVTLYAVWIHESYKVTFMPEGGTINSARIIFQAIEYNDTVDNPGTPVRDGYTFLGWYCGEDKFDFNTKITSDLILTAKWKEDSVITHTVVFNTTYGAAVQTQTVKDGEKAVKPENPTDEGGGGTFLEWLKNDATAYDFNTPVTEDIILNAKWEKSGTATTVVFYDVSFVNEDGSYIYGTTVKKGTTISVSDPVSKDRHKTFDYWKTEDGKKFDFNTKITKNITLTAVWRDLKVGDKGPAGGIIFYDAGCVRTSTYSDREGTVSYLWRYLEAAPEDLGNVYIFGYYRLTDNGENKTVGTGFNIGEGRLSTASLVFHMLNPTYVDSGGSEKGEHAAVRAWYYTLTNTAAARVYRDWFLPSASELDAMYQVKHLLGMNRGEYWSSTEDDWDYACYMDFESGAIDYKYRRDFCLVRPIRAF